MADTPSFVGSVGPDRGRCRARPVAPPVQSQVSGNNPESQCMMLTASCRLDRFLSMERCPTTSFGLQKKRPRQPFSVISRAGFEDVVISPREEEISLAGWGVRFHRARFRTANARNKKPGL